MNALAGRVGAMLASNASAGADSGAADQVPA
jgi:hypothetical protein